MRVFISYRRGDAVALAGRLYDRLGSRIGLDSVFMDHENIPVGQDFRQAISAAITRSDLLLVLIGPKWVELLKQSRTSPDFVLEEIATALEHDIPIIPVLLGDTSMPQQSDLPPRIEGLAMKNALKLEPGERFSSDFERLLQAPPFSASLKSSLIQRIRKWFRR
jgi:hypothetical protein